MILPFYDFDEDCTRICLECNDKEAFYCKNIQIKGQFQTADCVRINDKNSKRRINMKTKHSFNCSRVFKNYDLNCPRCMELKNGAQPREGWGDWKGKQEEIQLQSIRKHNCKERNCGIICTFGEW